MTEKLRIQCETCTFWRDKGWGADGTGTGICDNPIVIKQVYTMHEDHIKPFVKDERDARFIAQSLRFTSNFGCIHHRHKGLERTKRRRNVLDWLVPW